MTWYLVKRILQFIPTMFVISLLSFYISVNSPGDPVEILSHSSLAQGGSNTEYLSSKKFKDSVRVQLGLNLPLFYFSLNTNSDCDTIHKIFDKQEQYAFHRLSRTIGDWPTIAKYFKKIDALINSFNHINVDSIDKISRVLIDTTTQLVSIPVKSGGPLLQRQLINNSTICFDCADKINNSIGLSKNILQSLKIIYQPEFIQQKLDTLATLTRSKNYFTTQFFRIIELRSFFASMQINGNSKNNYLPKLTWHGSSNQYHKWLVNLLHGDFGYSYTDTRPVAEKIWQKFLRSFTLVLLSIILAYLISIPIGVYAAKNYGRFFDRLSSLLLFILYAIPSFFFGTILLYFFSNPQFFSWFPESGYCDPETYNTDWNFFQKIYYTFPFIVLPLLTYTYASFAFLSRIIRSTTLDALSQDYIRTARAKGLSENKILWRHAFINSLLPIITTFVTIFPAAIGGSVIIETIFTYDGMGIASYESIASKDIPMLVSIFTLAGLMSMVAYFLADILYAFVDPRITYKSSK